MIQHAPDILLEALLIPTRPTSLIDWAETDAEWWHELAGARNAYQFGKNSLKSAREATAKATAHLRSK